MNAESRIICKVCGLEAQRVTLDGKPSIKIDIDDFQEHCVEPSIAHDPFRCSNMLAAAMDAGIMP